ncbi:unnamed protein product [Rhizophagus irregularis]|uniref:MATA-HMG n=2 Tax=Rhizophagus irregularis TaxID=588596 RepID=A0A1B1ETW1_9GLOM|nr:MATA-HMG [Rhizophagus irregularis]PKK69030.1 hypothetical protein RhiirC2_866955 [Rhizophagus irregularis]CAB4387000.1 unnamed protein product [Rhizophagus irregularis]CAB5385927.1 unnamed protein product [Rhizophagus irregularis]
MVINKNKNEPNSSMDDLANSLMDKLDRSKVFPPFYNNPEELINPSKVRSVGPPRPPNGFLLCRKNVHRQARERGVCNMRVISKVTGMLWRGATADEKEQYENLALQVQNLHSERYPNYKYKPTSRAKTNPTLYQPYPIPQHQIIPPLINQIEPIISSYAFPNVLYNDNNGMIMQNDVDLYNTMYMSCL